MTHYSQITPEVIARVVRTVNKIHCESIGDYSQPDWDDAPQWQKESAIEGVLGILNGEITTPEESHKKWLKHKEETGWKYGPVKDTEKKEHPCMVPYDELPEEQKVKDKFFFGVVKSLLNI